MRMESILSFGTTSSLRSLIIGLFSFSEVLVLSTFSSSLVSSFLVKSTVWSDYLFYLSGPPSWRSFSLSWWPCLLGAFTLLAPEESGKKEPRAESLHENGEQDRRTKAAHEREGRRKEVTQKECRSHCDSRRVLILSGAGGGSFYEVSG